VNRRIILYPTPRVTHRGRGGRWGAEEIFKFSRAAVIRSTVSLTDIVSDVTPSLPCAFPASRVTRTTGPTANEALPIHADNLPTLAKRRQMVSGAKVSRAEVRTRNHDGRCLGLLCLIDHLSVTQEEPVRVLQQWFVKVLPVNWFKAGVRLGIDLRLLLQKGFDNLLWCRHGLTIY
jgi:hypothetical protein